MTQDEDWASTLTRTIGKNVQIFRGKLGLSAQKLSDLTSEVGHLIPRNSIANLENGRKSSISLQDVLVLSTALGIPLGSLIASPYEPVSTVRLLPHEEFKSLSAYLHIAPDLSLTSSLSDLNEVAEAQRLVHEYQNLLGQLNAIQMTFEGAKIEAVEQGQHLSSYSEEYFKETIRFQEERLASATKALEKIGIKPWELHEVNPFHA